MKYRKKPVVVDAHQWHRNGDHPEDYSSKGDEYQPAFRKQENWEGDIVRYFRRPDISGDTQCRNCGNDMHWHGWIDTLEGGHIVCPGDWIITGVNGERYPCKPDIFSKTYEEAL